jgi:hypothetical protein
MFTTILLYILISYVLMLLAYWLPRYRLFHVPVMASVILFDIGVPFYLYTHRHWWRRLVEQQDIFSFLVWMHFGLLIVMYVLEGMQVYSAARLVKGDPDAREKHRGQGKALLVARGLVILTGAILADPEDR